MDQCTIWQLQLLIQSPSSAEVHEKCFEAAREWATERNLVRSGGWKSLEKDPYYASMPEAQWRVDIVISGARPIAREEAERLFNLAKQICQTANANLEGSLRPMTAVELEEFETERAASFE